MYVILFAIKNICLLQMISVNINNLLTNRIKILPSNKELSLQSQMFFPTCLLYYYE